MELSILIASSRPEAVNRCLQSLATQNGFVKFEVIVAGIIKDVHSTAQNVTLLAVDQAHPNTKRNRAAELAKGRWIALLDDDTIPNPNWVNQAIAFARLHPKTIFTGPEIPPSTASSFAHLSHQVLSLNIAECTKGHVNQQAEKVQWYDVPFCNVVFPKEVWITAGGFNENIPWHMDDFHFFFPMRHHLEFQNLPSLLVEHDRYPASLIQLMKYKWRLRFETGEKVINYPIIYLAVRPIKIALVVSLLGLGLIPLLIYTAWYIIPVMLFIYICLLMGIVSYQLRTTRWLDILQGVCILFSIQFISFTALYWGMLSQTCINHTKH